MTIAHRLFDGDMAKSELEDKLTEAGVPCDHIGWDYYDISLEIYEVPNDYRLSPEAQKVIFDTGFIKVYVNHLDKWETHYTWSSDEFVYQPGWRVSYPHKRADGTSGILVEKPVDSWPKDWFETGYVKVVAA